MELSEAKLLRAPEDENARLKAVAGGRDARQRRSVFDGMDRLLTRPGRKVPILCKRVSCAFELLEICDQEVLDEIFKKFTKQRAHVGLADKLFLYLANRSGN